MDKEFAIFAKISEVIKRMILRHEYKSAASFSHFVFTWKIDLLAPIIPCYQYNSYRSYNLNKAVFNG